MRARKPNPRTRRRLRLALPLLGTFSHKVMSPLSGELYRYGIAGVAKFIARSHIKHARLEMHKLGLGVVSIGADDHAISDFCLVRCCAVDRDHPRSFFTANSIGGESLTVVDVVDLDLFVLTNARQVQPFAVDGAGAFVVQDCVRHLRTMQFGFEHDGVHGAVIPWSGADCRSAGSCPETPRRAPPDRDLRAWLDAGSRHCGFPGSQAETLRLRAPCCRRSAVAHDSVRPGAGPRQSA